MRGQPEPSANLIPELSAKLIMGSREPTNVGNCTRRHLSAPNVVTVHMSYRLWFRHSRRAVLGPVCLIVACGVVIDVSVLYLTHSNRAAPADHISAASLLLALLGILLAFPYLFWVTRRIGYYARPGELGSVGIGGRLTPFRQPAVRFHRFTMTSPQWVRFLGQGSMVNVPAIVAVTETGRRSLMLLLVAYPQADVDSLLAASGLPVEGDYSERVGRSSIRKRWPGSGDKRSQSWVAIQLVLPVVLLIGGLAAAAAFLVH